jgi:DNA-binding response OmpR family regulator
MKSIVLVDDDPLTTQEMADYLMDYYSVPVDVFGSAEAYFNSGQHQNALYLVDWNLPHLNGDAIVRAIRHRDKISTIFMISGIQDQATIEKALALGADDYLIKPFSPTQVISKIETSLNRTKAIIENSLELGIHFIPEVGLVLRDGKRVVFTHREFEVFECLYKGIGETLSRDKIIPYIKEKDISERNVDLYVYNIRKKVGLIGYEIETVKGKGYCLQETSSTARLN